MKTEEDSDSSDRTAAAAAAQKEGGRVSARARSTTSPFPAPKRDGFSTGGRPVTSAVLIPSPATADTLAPV